MNVSFLLASELRPHLLVINLTLNLLFFKIFCLPFSPVTKKNKENKEGGQGKFRFFHKFYHPFHFIRHYFYKSLT